MKKKTKKTQTNRYFGECHRRAARDCVGNIETGLNVPRNEADYGPLAADIHPPVSEYASADIYYSKPEFEWAEDVWVNYSPWPKSNKEPSTLMMDPETDEKSNSFMNDEQTDEKNSDESPKKSTKMKTERLLEETDTTNKTAVVQQPPKNKKPPLLLALSIQSVHTFTGVPRLEDEFLSSFIRRRVRLDRTVVILHSDHGRISGGPAEHMISSFMVSIPKWIFAKHPGLLETMRKNEKQLYSHYDTWLSFRQIPFLSSPSSILFDKILKIGKENYSVLSHKQRLENPEITGIFMDLGQKYEVGRDCKQAQIDDSLCQCVKWSKGDPSSQKAVETGKIGVEYLKTLLKPIINKPCRDVNFQTVLEFEFTKSFARTSLVTVSAGRKSGPAECTWDFSYVMKKEGGVDKWVVDQARRMSPMTEEEDSLPDSVFSNAGLVYDTKNLCLV